MTFDGYKSISTAKIIAPGDLRARQKSTDVKDLAASIKKLGDEPIHAITARRTKRGWEIVAGRDRYAALVLLKAKSTWVHVVVEATPLELIEAEIHENLRRRVVDRDKLVASLVERTEKLLGEIPHNLNGNSPRQGRPKTARGEAREIVAKAEGTTTEAVRAAEYREARDEGPAGNRDEKAAPPAPPIETWGLPLSAEAAYLLVDEIEGLKEIDHLGRRAQVAVTKLVNARLPEAHAQRILSVAHELGVLARAVMPAAICPYCLNGARSTPVGCNTCGATGYVRAEQLAGIPRELKVPVDGALKDRATKVLAASARADAAEQGTDEYDLAVAELHGLSGPCKCVSCGNAKKIRARAEKPAEASGIDRHIERASRAVAPTAPKRLKRLSIDMGDGKGPRSPEEIINEPTPELTVERDDEAWAAP